MPIVENCLSHAFMDKTVICDTPIHTHIQTHASMDKTDASIIDYYYYY